jgi:2,4-diaminopentanoate dehydrogenase
VQSLKAIIVRPDLELVGVVVHYPEKIGVDAGELRGISDR